jgi:hypothetical protein
LVVLAALGPFLAKPFNLDDPLFIWVAQQIYLHPTNPYGFDVNWAQTVFPMWNCTENPPLACYYLALGAGFFGWSEIGLHFAFVLPALAVICGTHRLARHFCDRPMLAALATLFTPVFLVSSLTVMCDVLMLAFWVWAVVWWVEGMERDDFGRLAVSGLFIALAALTKYYGMCLVPLLGAYGLLIKGRPGRWMVLSAGSHGDVVGVSIRDKTALRARFVVPGGGIYDICGGALWIFQNSHCFGCVGVYGRLRGRGGCFYAIALADAGAGGIGWPDGADGWRFFVQRSHVG